MLVVEMDIGNRCQGVGSSLMSASGVMGLIDQKSVADQLCPGASSREALALFKKFILARPASTYTEYWQFRLNSINTRWVIRNEKTLVQE